MFARCKMSFILRLITKRYKVRQENLEGNVGGVVIGRFKKCFVRNGMEIAYIFSPTYKNKYKVRRQYLILVKDKINLLT